MKRMEAPAAPRHARPLKALTQGIVEFYKSCSVDYAYSTSTTLGVSWVPSLI